MMVETKRTEPAVYDADRHVFWQDTFRTSAQAARPFYVQHASHRAITVAVFTYIIPLQL